MGKKQHQKDRLFLTRNEWNQEWGGYKKKQDVRFKRLPFYCCGISLQPFQDPVCASDGTVFDLTSVVPYVHQYKCHPVTGEAMKLGDLFHLHFHKNLQGDYWCPVLNKVFTEHTHIVAIKTTGNVYCYQAVLELNVKAKNFKDLLTEEPFTRQDIIHIQNPSDLESRAIESFHYVKHNQSVAAGSKDAQGGGASNIRMVSEDSRRILKSLSSSSSQKEKSGKSSSDSKTKEERTKVKINALAEPCDVPKKAGTATWDTSLSQASGAKPAANLAGVAKGMKTERGRSSTGAVSRSFTSTSMSVQTVNERELVHKEFKPKKKGYVRLCTSHGDLNIELHCDITPRTCNNFISLCESKYYDNCVFHRSIRNFMIQGGDPTGTGKGGKSIYGGAFKDELDSRLLHGSRGVLAMANSGKNTNRSQFYILFRPAPHLDYKHTVFGKVVGGLQVLNVMEDVPTDEGDRPTEEIRIKSCVVFTNPFAEMMQQEEEKAAAAAAASKVEDDNGEEEERGRWFSNPAGAGGGRQSNQSGGIGKYLSSKRPSSKATSSKSPASKGSQAPQKKKLKTSYGNFDSW